MVEKSLAVPTKLKRPLVCVVEDDRALLASIGFLLGLEDMEARCFPNATKLLSDGPSAPAVDCFVIDQVLPDLPGLDLLERLRGEGHEAPAILMTTNPKQATKARAAVMGVRILEKPILGDDLATAIRLAIAS
jgi:FixJ family two-component response regulator